MKESPTNLNSDQEFLKTNLTLFLSRVIKTIMGLVKERNYRRKKYPRYTKTVTILDVRAALMLLEYPIPEYLNKLGDISRDMALKQENTITKESNFKRKSTRRLIKSDQIIQDSEVGRGLLLTLVSSTAYFSYDRYQYMIINQDLEKKFKVFGSLPIKPGDPSDKLKIYIAPSFYAMNWFNSYIRPFLYIGGMDYELVQKELDQIQEDVVNTIKNSRDRWITQTIKIRDRTWIEYFRGIDAPTKDILKVQNEFKGIVGVGPEVYDLVLAGYDHGVHCTKESHVEDCTNSEKSENLENLEPSRITATVEDYKNYPTLFNLPGKEQTGWRGFPKRIFWAFNQRWILQQVGDELVEIFKKVE